jgi:hypothetical protein
MLFWVLLVSGQISLRTRSMAGARSITCGARPDTAVHRSGQQWVDAVEKGLERGREQCFRKLID